VARQSAPPSGENGAEFTAGTATDIGLFAQRLSADDFTGRGALFLDRDGVIVEETNYLHRPDDIRMIHGVAEAIAVANRAGIPVVIVTNQAGIGRGYYQWADFHAVQQHIAGQLESAEAKADMVLACAYHADACGEYRWADHPWRKPRPGMLIEAAKELGIDLSSSFIVGDCLSDMQAGAQAGLRSGAIVRTGHGHREWEAKGPQTLGALERDAGFMAERFDNAQAAITAWMQNR
jgi:D-glycero-D-manno-heptose 1,7-bisphosphate phosphatase